MVAAPRWRAATTSVDAALALTLSLWTVAATVQRSSEHVPSRVVLGVLTVLALVARTRAPMSSALLVSAGVVAESLFAESPDEIPVLLAIVISAFSVAAYAERGRAPAGLAGIAVAILVALATDPSDDLSDLVATLALFLVLPAGLGYLFRRRGDDLDALQERNRAAEQAAVLAAEAAAEAERRRLARELHDVVSHAVTLIAVQAEAGRSVLDTDPGAARASLDAISVASRDALAELQSLLTLLHEAKGAAGSGLADLPTLVDGVRGTGVRVDVAHASGDDTALPRDVDHCAYRVVQEGLTNALRHTRAPRVSVNIDRDAAGVTVCVVSRGRAHQSSYGGSGRGIEGLRERVRTVGGELENGMEHDGYVLRARFPVGAS